MKFKKKIKKIMPACAGKTHSFVIKEHWLHKKGTLAIGNLYIL